MELITFDHQAYRELVDKINRIADYVFNREASQEQKQETWLTSEEVADLLKISTRTLQRMRKEQVIPYTVLRRRCLYRLSDIEECITRRVITCSPQTLDDFYKNYRLTQTTSRHEP